MDAGLEANEQEGQGRGGRQEEDPQGREMPVGWV